MARSLFENTLRTLAVETAALTRHLRPAPSGTVRILYYHRIDDEDHRSCVTPQAFADQMAFLRQEGFQLLPLAAVRAHLDERRPFPERSAIVTFDDGFADNYTRAFPILDREGVPATIFLTAKFIGTGELPVLRDRSGLKPLTWEQATEMARHGIELGAHTLSHRSLTELDDAEVRHELSGSRSEIEQQTGARVRTFCYPRGHFDARVKGLVREAGFDLACTTLPGCVEPANDAFTLRRTFIARDDNLRSFRHKLEGSFDLLHAARQRWSAGAHAPMN
jgi:peptidoglycan/xylan/chitin deacetylase (PgdA/CDA1 family)